MFCIHGSWAQYTTSPRSTARPLSRGMSPSSASSSDVLPLPTGPSTMVSEPRLSERSRALSVGGRAASSARDPCSARAERTLSAEWWAPWPNKRLLLRRFFFFPLSDSTAVSGQRNAAPCSSIAGAPAAAGKRERKCPSSEIGASPPTTLSPSPPPSSSTASRPFALRKRERRPLTTDRSITRVIIIGTTRRGKRMIWKSESEVKAVAAVSLLPSAE
mmetsp:Transcript_15416/g.49620  ORF Transcript_15416/g.49620 Transcript_15416/m.49620 type:complete len:217 (+) Transcript_15416:2647-3297(+)